METEFQERPEEQTMDSLPGLMCLLAQVAEPRLSTYAKGDVTKLINRARALEAFWSAWKDVEASGVGYSASFTEAAKKLRELEA